MSDTRRRVKLYTLNEERQWEDRGTGHVCCSLTDSLRVTGEADGSLLLESTIQPGTAYQKQQDTLIVWSEAENCDLALSFQEKAGCDELWEKICQVQGKDPSVEITQDPGDESEEELAESGHPLELPPCEPSRLEELEELVMSVLPSPVRREKLALALLSLLSIRKLLQLFRANEEAGDRRGLQQLHQIVRGLLLLNKATLLEVMFSDDCIMDVVGCLEYEPALLQPKSHRQFLTETARFREVIPIRDSELRQKIHQTYRVQYIQDIILPTHSVLEDNFLSTLSSFIFFNKVEIVSMLQVSLSPQDTLIVWSEAENCDLALSFQEKAGCDELWEKICQVQGKDPSVEITQDPGDESEEELAESGHPLELPPCEPSRLEELEELVMSVLPSPVRREKLALALLSSGYIRKLLQLFRASEEEGDRRGLQQLHQIVRGLLLLNKATLLEVMFSDDCIMDVVGCLEYEPALLQPKSHRQFLTETARFREVIPIRDSELRQKIHQTYRVQYIQDIILPTHSVLEDNFLSTLSSFLFFNKVEIVSMLQVCV
ncbi:serine/threonine-protein phosphatase 4 regulatory subunit 3B-like [Sinocyclocheilus rhinocerous]|uniref:serine/threonine-protein phosphatase 4 regulatory subunit 3B-like n=1 Tax=Sinocyclocheilus rhinocerous TaxID=307959 RepID=UPI0007B79030|nr:PREDICTED: serine/threonine-protein phosphatase 4 regulatory subunit 3B-like [Sinocyclocheilus rhinocerous]